MRRPVEKIEEFKVCPKCNYHNHKENIDRYGSCNGCGEVLDKKAKYQYEMVCKLKLWRKKEWRK